MSYTGGYFAQWTGSGLGWIPRKSFSHWGSAQRGTSSRELEGTSVYSLDEDLVSSGERRKKILKFFTFFEIQNNKKTQAYLGLSNMVHGCNKTVTQYSRSIALIKYTKYYTKSYTKYSTKYCTEYRFMIVYCLVCS